MLLAGASVLLVAVAAVRLTSRTGLPSLLLYLGLGVLLGDHGLGVHFDDAGLAGVLGYCALILILAEGGLTTRWETIRAAVAPASALPALNLVAGFEDLGDNVRKALRFAECILQYRFQYDIELDAAPTIMAGEFDIEIS